MTATVDLSSASQVAARLREYLATAFADPALRFAEPPAPLGAGWETYIYQFRLQPGPAVDAIGAAHLVARIHAGRGVTGWGSRHARQEFEGQRAMAEAGFPVPRPILYHDTEPFGTPFFLMERAPGIPMLDAMLARGPGSLFTLARDFGEIHARLHQMPVAGFPAGMRPFLDQRLDEMAEMIDSFGLEGIRPGLDWLREHRPPPADRESIVHLDFHPANLLVDGNRVTAVLDWGDSGVGDRHVDVATTLMIVSFAPVERASRREQLIAATGRRLLIWSYRRAYQKHLPIDRSRMPYWAAWSAFRWLTYFTAWSAAGPDAATGSKPESVRWVTPQFLGWLTRYIHEYTGLRLRPDLVGSAPASKRS